MKRHSILKQFNLWRLKHITDKQFILILSVVIGFLAGTAAVLIKNTVHFIGLMLTGWFAEGYENYMYIFYPAIGILIVMIFIKFILRQPIQDGVQEYHLVRLVYPP